MELQHFQKFNWFGEDQHFVCTIFPPLLEKNFQSLEPIFQKKNRIDKKSCLPPIYHSI